MKQLLSASLRASALVVTLLGATAASAQQSVVYIGWSQDEAASKPTIGAMFKRYQDANPGTKLDVVGFPWAQMQQNLVLSYRSRQKVDVVQIQERWLPGFEGMGALVDLNEVYGKAYLESQIDPGLLALGRIGGKQAGLPWTAGSIGMVANKQVLADAGVTKIPETVEEFTGALRAIKKAKPNSVPYALSTKNAGSMSPDFQTWLWTFGGRVFDLNGTTPKDIVKIDSPEARAALGYLVSLAKEGLVAPDVDRPDARRLFAQFDVGFYGDAPLARGFARNNSGKGAAYDVNVVAVATPVLKPGDTSRSVMWGHTLAMFKQAATPQKDSAGVKLIDTLVFSDDSQLAYFNEVGLFPVTKTALAKVQNDAYVTTWVKNAGTALRDEASPWPNASDLTTVIGEEVQSAYLGLKPVDKAITDMGERLRTEITQHLANKPKGL